MKNHVRKPIQRSPLRLACGRAYFTVKRWADWYLSGQTFAHSREDLSGYPEVVFAHQSPLYRELPRVDLWMQRNKVVNLGIAVRTLDGTVIFPGEVFSYWRLIGPPTRQKGYLDGMILQAGTVRAGIAGGLCQLSNLIYWMTVHTPLTVTERWRHGYDVFPDSGRTLPFGSGATCSYPSLDLQIRNLTDKPFQLHLWLTDTHLHGEWRSAYHPEKRYLVYQAAHCITQEPWGGYVRHNVLRRQILQADGTILGDEPLTENHALMMYPPFLAEKQTG